MGEITQTAITLHHILTKNYCATLAKWRDADVREGGGEGVPRGRGGKVNGTVCGVLLAEGASEWAEFRFMWFQKRRTGHEEQAIGCVVTARVVCTGARDVRRLMRMTTSVGS